jgi:opacity protein-like surface antigen
MRKFLIAGVALSAWAGMGAVTVALADDAPGSNLVSGAQLAQMPPPPPAIDWTGFYFGGFIGGATGSTVHSTEPTLPGLIGSYNGVGANPPTGNYSYREQGNILGGGQFGYNWQLPGTSWVLGLEGEGGTLRLKGQTLDPNASIFGTTDSTDKTRTGGWYGIAAGRVGWTWGNVLFYGKGGVGFTDFNTSYNDGCILGPGCGPAVLHISTTKTDVFPVGGGGVEFSINPQWSVKAEYLYMSTGENVAMCGPGGFGGPVAFVDCTTHKVSDGTHTFKVGFNFHFAAPPPPPPAPVAAPAPPPAAPTVFIVFFDWDKDRITPQGMAIVHQAADAWKAGAPVQIQVTGYTDRSGSAGYNQRLSERRANNVAKALAALGIPPASMAVSGRGENDNRVPTADGVREPQNRRVEIIKM